jgi:excisionase family DNA binding protein
MGHTHTNEGAAPGPDVPQMLSLKHTAEALDVSTKTVRRLLERGDLTAIRVGGRLRIDAADIRGYLERQAA